MLLLPSSPLCTHRRGWLTTLIAAAIAAAGCSGGGAAPTFGYTLLDGSQHGSQALRGQVVLVNFWATSCAPCVAEMPRLAALHRRFAGRGLTTLAVAVQQDPPALVSDFAARRRLPFGVVIDNTGEIARRFGTVGATPTTVVINRDGTIALRIVGTTDFDALAVRLDRLLAGA